MRLEEVCDALLRLEADNDVNGLSWNGVSLWPLVRQCIWSGLVRSSAQEPQNYNVVRRTQLAVERYRRVFSMISRRASSASPGVTSVFVSQAVNLQEIPGSGLLFDRIVDPLMFQARHRERVEKFYVGSLPAKGKLFFPAKSLLPSSVMVASPGPALQARVLELIQQVGLPAQQMERAFLQAWKSFYRWYRLGLKLYRENPDLRRVYLSSWYFPETMGLIAAARKWNIVTIDVQHGKQGKFQGMYSWWTRIPEEGYALMPDWFWCWGEPSCRHILASSPKRSRHMPFVGGFPWPDYYRQFLWSGSSRNNKITNGRKRVLFTLQGPAGAHNEPVPEFIVQHLRSGEARDQFFIFRVHPNFPSGVAYCRQRLRGVPAQRYHVHDGKINLYDELMGVERHITAFSSCCYEASMFGVPTLLFGPESREAYAEDIESGRFSWTHGNVDDLRNWLSEPHVVEEGPLPYIEASLALTGKQISSFHNEGVPQSNLIEI